MKKWNEPELITLDINETEHGRFSQPNEANDSNTAETQCFWPWWPWWPGCPDNKS